MADTTLYPTADAYVGLGSPDTNYGTYTVVRVTTRTDNDHRGFLKFDLATLPAGVVIGLAKLRMKCYGVAALLAGVTDVQARRVADDTWTELGITWNNQPDYGVVEDTKVPAVGWVEWDVTSFVQAEWTNDKIVSFCMRCVEESYDATLRTSVYRSREYNAEDPELYIEYTVPTVHKVTVAEKLGMVDAVKSARGLHVSTAEKLGLKDAVSKVLGVHVTVAEKLGLVDNYFKRVTMGKLPDNPDNVGSRGSPIYKDMPDYMGAVYVNTKNTWQDAENLDGTHGYTSYVWIPEECFKVKILKLHVYAEKFRAHSKAAKEETPSHTHDVVIGAKTSNYVTPSHTHTVDYGTKTSAAGGGAHSHDVTGQTTVYGGEHGHALAHEDLNRTTGSHAVTIAEMPVHRHEVVSTGDTHTADAGGDEGHTHPYKDFYAVNAPVGGEHNHSVTGATSTVETPDHTHDVVIGAKTTASGGGSHRHTVDYGTKTSASGAGTHGHKIDYGIYEEPWNAQKLSAKLYDPNGNLLKDFEVITTGEEDVILDLTEYFKDLKYGMYRLELTASDRIRARLVYYELGIMFAM